ncbi:hypothetical protein ACWDTI_24265 [Gordonia sp. NPDC003424]
MRQITKMVDLRSWGGTSGMRHKECRGATYERRQHHRADDGPQTEHPDGVEHRVNHEVAHRVTNVAEERGRDLDGDGHDGKCREARDHRFLE